MHRRGNRRLAAHFGVTNVCELRKRGGSGHAVHAHDFVARLEAGTRRRPVGVDREDHKLRADQPERRANVARRVTPRHRARRAHPTARRARTRRRRSGRRKRGRHFPRNQSEVRHAHATDQRL